VKGDTAMSKYLSIFLLLAIVSFNSCFNDDGDSGATSGTVTITLTGASAYNDKICYFSIFTQSDIVNPQGLGSFTIAAGGGTGVIQSGGSDLTLSNDTYIINCFIDVDDSADPSGPLVETGDYYYLAYAVVSGNITIDLTYPDDFELSTKK
jgi:hypothetical protein